MSTAATPWWGRPWLVKLLLAFLLLYFGQNVVFSMFFKVTDFEWHLDHARAFFGGGVYDTGFLTYPLPRIMLDGLYLPLGQWARPLAYLVALGVLGWMLLLWHRLLLRYAGFDSATSRLSLLWALVILSDWIGRDLNDCGPTIILLFFLTLALSRYLEGRSFWAGFWLALAFVWKATPLLFLPYLLLKRSWASALWFLVFALLWLASPAIFVGWTVTLDVYENWMAGIWRLAQASDLSFLGFELPRHQNQSFRALLARYLAGYGPGHEIHIDTDLTGHPLFVQFLRLEPPWPSRIHRGILLAFGLLFAWLFRHPLSRMPKLRVLGEWSVVPIIATLLSPLAWLHHFTVAFPALWLAVALFIQGGGRRRGALLGLSFITLSALVLQRDLLQRELSVLDLSYKLDAFAMMVLIALTLVLAIGQSGKRPASLTGQHGLPRFPPPAGASP